MQHFDDVDIARLRRRRTVKWTLYGPDVLAAWVAEMDFDVAPPVRAALLEAVDREDFGYVEGQTIKIEYRWADGKFDKLPDLAADLVHNSVDVIVAGATQASIAAKKSTTTIPIVMIGVSDPVGAGLSHQPCASGDER